MDNFFKRRREQLDATQRAIALAADVTEKAVINWENDLVVPKSTIATLAKAYQVSESVMEKEVMAQRRRIEARNAKVVASVK